VQHIEKSFNNNTSSVPRALVGLFKLFNNVTCQLFELIFTFQNFKFSKIWLKKYIYLHGVCGDLIFFLEILDYKMKGGVLLPHKVVHPHACQFSIDGN
jgi:hypothetical protein